jgi:ATP adenylyltransferase
VQRGVTAQGFIPNRALVEAAGMTKPLWAPWRLDYIKSADEQQGCFLCDAPTQPAEDALLVRLGEQAFVVLNKYPYASGHLLVAPRRHVGAFGALDDAEALEIHRLAGRGVAALESVYGAQGFNVGWNLGRVAGAGLPGHVHLHVVPRWSGDTNYMPVLADVKVLPEHLLETRRKLADAWGE